MTKSQNRPGESSSDKPGDTASEKAALSTSSEKAAADKGNVNPEEALRPFQDAAAKFLQAIVSAQQSATKQRTQAYLDFYDNLRKVEQEAYQTVMDATKKHVEKLGQQTTNSPEEVYTAGAQSQFDYEKQVRQVSIDTQAKLKDLVQKSFGEDGGDPTKQFADERQKAYQTYLADLQQAWANTKALDPQTIKAIASNILFTLQMV